MCRGVVTLSHEIFRCSVYSAGTALTGIRAGEQSGRCVMFKKFMAFFGIQPRKDRLAEALGAAMREACSQMARESHERMKR